MGKNHSSQHGRHLPINSSVSTTFRIHAHGLASFPSTARLAHGCYHHDANQGSAKKLFFQDVAPGQFPGEVCSRKGDAPNVDQVTMRNIVPHGVEQRKRFKALLPMSPRVFRDQFEFLIKNLTPLPGLPDMVRAQFPVPLICDSLKPMLGSGGDRARSLT